MLRNLLVQLPDNAGVDLLLTKLHHHPHSRHCLCAIFFRNQVGESSLQGQGKNNFDKKRFVFHHVDNTSAISSCDGSTFFFSLITFLKGTRSTSPLWNPTITLFWSSSNA